MSTNDLPFPWSERLDEALPVGTVVTVEESVLGQRAHGLIVASVGIGYDIRIDGIEDTVWLTPEYITPLADCKQAPQASTL